MTESNKDSFMELMQRVIHGDFLPPNLKRFWVGYYNIEIPIWHADLPEIIETLKIVYLSNYNILIVGVNDVWHSRLKKKATWTLFCPSEFMPEDEKGKDFTNLYNEHEKNPTTMKR